MRQDDRRSRSDSGRPIDQRIGGSRQGQQSRSRQRYSYESPGRRTNQQSRSAQRTPGRRLAGTGGTTEQPVRRQPHPRGAARDWPDRLEVERREREKKEQERKRQLKLQKKRRAKIRRRVLLCTTALLGVALFLAVRLMKNWNVQPEEKEEKAEETEQIDIEELAAEEEYPESLLMLLEKNPETKDFVLDYPKNKDKHVDIDISKEVKQGEVPLFLQWDERWGYEIYGDDFLALTGCGPTCLSMVYCSLSGNSTWNPYKTARMAENSGYYVSGAGSSWDLMTEGASRLGLTAEAMIFDEEHIRAALEAGTPIICVVGPGDFTNSGHFLVLTGVDEEGKITLNDPNSKIRSKESWDINQLMSQIKNLWAYSYNGAEGNSDE